ncbi:hypothetical protein C0993_003495 [Termitomyces sp. T159_Od127]|nr:hypothetical protein C0993_003495 [Termitomyces sp. T159_Od127]
MLHLAYRIAQFWSNRPTQFMLIRLLANANGILVSITFSFKSNVHGSPHYSVAYFTEESIENLLSVDDIPHLADLVVPNGKYKSARSTKSKPDHILSDATEFPRLEYIPYTPKPAPLSPSGVDDASCTRSAKQIEPSSQTRHRGARNSWSMSSDEFPADSLAPLEYLQNMAPPRRHPIDEKALQQLHYSKLLL